MNRIDDNSLNRQSSQVFVKHPSQRIKKLRGRRLLKALWLFKKHFLHAICYEKMFKNTLKRSMLPRPLVTAPLKRCFLVLESSSLKTEVRAVEDRTEDLTLSSPWWEGAPSSSLEHHALYLLPEPQHPVPQGLALWSSTPGVTPSHSESVLCLQIV